MCAQKSNREALIEGALRCLERQPVGSVTARDIATESGANLASIGYHFSSKDALLAHALAEGFRRWSAELAVELAQRTRGADKNRLREVLRAIRDSIERHRGFVRAYLGALALAPYDDELRQVLRDSYREGARAVSAMLALGTGQGGDDAAALLIAGFDGVLIQFMLENDAWLTPTRVERGFERLIATLRALG